MEGSIPKLVYICSRYSGDTVGNAAKAVRYSRFAVNEGVVPIAPHLLLPLYMDEATERAKAKDSSQLPRATPETRNTAGTRTAIKRISTQATEFSPL